MPFLRCVFAVILSFGFVHVPVNVTVCTSGPFLRQNTVVFYSASECQGYVLHIVRGSVVDYDRQNVADNVTENAVIKFNRPACHRCPVFPAALASLVLCPQRTANYSKTTPRVSADIIHCAVDLQHSGLFGCTLLVSQPFVEMCDSNGKRRRCNLRNDLLY